MSEPSPITRYLLDLSIDGGDRAEATGQLFPIVYEELRRMAGRILAGERKDHTLQPTALVHEAYMKLVDQNSVEWQDRAHFLGIASRAMRQILVDHARSRAAAKRGGDWQRVTMDEARDLGVDSDFEILALHEAIEKLSVEDERVGKVAELRLFGGMTVKETSHVLGVSPRTVDDDWAIARMWLSREIKDSPGDTAS